MTKRRKRQGIMLAYPWTDARQRKLPLDVIVQPKLRGIRCRVEWFKSPTNYKESPYLLSSTGRVLTGLDHIKDILYTLPPHLQFQLDGEIYVHGWSQERINSAALRSVDMNNPDTKLLEYHIFDLIENIRQSGRVTLAIGIVEFINKYVESPIKMVETFKICKHDVITAAGHFVDRGYEGIIVRYPDNIYETKRSTKVVKLKPTEEDTYRIIGVKNAVDKYGVPMDMVGSFEVVDNEGITFNVSAGKLTHEKRLRYWEDWENLNGRMLHVKHELIKTKNRVPLCAVALKVE